MMVLSDAEHDTWKKLHAGFSHRLPRYGCREVLDGVRTLGLGEAIESFEVLSDRLYRLAGWRVTGVDGLLPAREFFELLSHRIYPIVRRVRQPHELEFAELPDRFHDTFGHLPPLAHPAYCEFLHKWATVAIRHFDSPAVVEAFARAYWYTIETGLVIQGGEPRVFGAAVLTSHAECERAMLGRAERIPMDLDTMFRTGFDNLRLQPQYFVVESFDALLSLADEFESWAERASRPEPRIITSPNYFIVEDYAPGLTIDFRQPASITEVERARRAFDVGQIVRASSDAHLAGTLGRRLVDLGVTEDESDFAASLRAFTGETELRPQLVGALSALGVDPPSDGIEQLVPLLLERTGCLDRSPHHALRLYCHVPGGMTVLEPDATHFGYVLGGRCLVKEARRTVPVEANMFFCVAGGAVIEGPGQLVVITRFDYRGLTLYGGEVEGWGRLRYIDGCTDTLLVPPVRKGDPCLNSLYFPPATEQTAHVHPSVRCGVIIAGQGVCKTAHGDFPLTAGKIFFLPPETYHSFHTDRTATSDRASLTVVAFHPDSDFGPTNDDHPMLNRTYFRFLHRLKSISSGMTGSYT